MFDKSQTPYMRADELCQHFDLSPKSGSAKSPAIMELLKSGQADPNWTLSSRMADNPMAWLIQVNGLIVDARHTPPDQDQLTLPNAQQFKHTAWLRDEVSYEFDSGKGIDQI